MKILLFLLVAVMQTAWSQQNYFNVPSFEITPENVPFFQQQFNLSSRAESNLTFDYGLGNNMEVGFNLYGVQFKNSLMRDVFHDDLDSKYRQLYLLNFQKGFHLSEHLEFSLGAQAGVRREFGHDDFANMFYAAYSYSVKEKYRFTAGPWYGNKKYTKDIETVGIQAGLEYHLLGEYLHFVGDTISGKTSMSVTVLGFNTYVIHDWPISLGWQFPNGPGGGQMIVIEITYRKEDI